MKTFGRLQTADYRLQTLSNSDGLSAKSSVCGLQSAVCSSRGFTLIELLTVIGIMAILAGLLFPVIKIAIIKGEASQARGDIKNIEHAIKSYVNEYGKLPVPVSLQGGADSACYYFTSPAQNNLINTLRAIPTGDNAGHALNLRQIVFLETTSRKGAFAPDGSFLDPWGKAYAIQLDCNYNGEVENYFSVNYRQTCIVISYGPNGTQESPAVKNDDIYNFQ